ncbi:PiggyBac transposable element-derived protein 4 [Plakobranchus ocellatus]|uniref:PiggyBac transposable element-derived protein 4 n=1 Tax=Plakobranchus ocellatus TaxID=259542 RepID=A0AAV3YNB0_9GAST|nr:PiggyBac transposable element-derived protein 4 [Plakobranchus ocellatus]
MASGDFRSATLAKWRALKWSVYFGGYWKSPHKSEKSEIFLKASDTVILSTREVLGMDDTTTYQNLSTKRSHVYVLVLLISFQDRHTDVDADEVHDDDDEVHNDDDDGSWVNDDDKKEEEEEEEEEKAENSLFVAPTNHSMRSMFNSALCINHTYSSELLLNILNEVNHHKQGNIKESESEDENMAVYAADTEVDDGPDVDLVVELDQDQQNYDSGEWQKNINGFPKLPRFSAQPGIKVALSDDPSPLEVYKLFITDELINSWKAETNRYARAIINSKDQQLLSNRSRFKLWTPFTLQEMWNFIAICIHMGLDKKPTLRDYWTRHPVLHSSFAPKVMVRERFLSILAFLHINDNDSFVPHGQPDHDPIQKIRPFVHYLNAKFKEVYQPQREVCIDEAMIPFKGRSRCKVYMKDKLTKWGIKLYELCESSSGYVWSVEMYCAEKRISNKPVDVTMCLLQPLLDQGYRLYVDNYYCCPDLWNQLQGRNTMLVGTCRKNRVGMPVDLFQNRQRPGDFDFARKGQLVAKRWFDKREVVTLSTIHQPQLTETIGRYEVKEKPLAVIDYIKFMSGVDHSDQLLSYFPMRRRSQKWWKKHFSIY